MGRRADRRGKAGTDRNHQSHAERERVVAHADGRIIDNGIEHGTRGCVGDELRDERSHQADGCHDDKRVVAANVQDAVSHHLCQAGLLDGSAQHHRTGKHHQDVPVDGLHGLVDRAALAEHHDERSKEGCLQQSHHAQRRQSNHGHHDERRHKRLLADVGQFGRFEELQLFSDITAQIVHLGRTFHQDGVACLQLDFAGTLRDSFAPAAHGNKGKLVGRLIARLAPEFADDLAPESYGSCLQGAVFVHFIDTEHVVVCIDKTVRLLQFDDVIDLAGINKTVSAKNELIGRDRRYDLLVETHNLDELATLHFVESGLFDGFAYMLAVCGHQQFHGVVARRFEPLFRSLTVGQQAPHGNHREDADAHAEQSGHQRREHVHGFSGLFGIHSRDNHVGWCSDERADTAHARGIAQRDKQFRRSDVEFLSPHLYHIDKECHYRGVVQKRGEHGHGDHQAHDGLRVRAGRAQQMFGDPLENTRMYKSGNDNEQGTDDHHRRAAEA